MDGVDTIRETPFGGCIGRKILDITTGDFGDEDEYRVYFHLDNGETFFATMGNENSPGLVGFLAMNSEEEEN